jgi:hypothetical protein
MDSCAAFFVVNVILKSLANQTAPMVAIHPISVTSVIWMALWAMRLFLFMRICAAVKHLLASGRPHYIIGSVMAVVVDALQHMMCGWLSSNMFQKGSRT